MLSNFHLYCFPKIRKFRLDFMDISLSDRYILLMLYGEIIKHLYSDYNKPVRDPIWKHIYLSEGLFKIVSSQPFQKLNGIKQLGPAYHVYPGATHTRFNHSLGVFYLAHKMASLLDFEKYDIPITLEGVKSFLCAALLHDIGHFPYAHSLKELPLYKHEQLTGEIILNSEISSIIGDSVKTDPYCVAAIVDDNLSDNNNPEIAFFRRILSGVLDPDKLDYLNRDAYFCGIPYGIQDIDFLISKMVPDFKRGIGVNEQGMSGIENILFSKYLMYKSVYWHKAVRIATAMIKKALYTALYEKAIKPENLYQIDDDQFVNRFVKEKHPSFELIEKVKYRNLYKTVYEENFSPKNRFHVDCLDLERRFLSEEDLAKRLNTKPGGIIIDIPEPISFEIDVPIFYEDVAVNFSESDTVFQPDAVKRFTATLRKIRIFASPEIYDKALTFFGNKGWKK